jgi:5,5'-dehydrodivanillate O-demethylase
VLSAQANDRLTRVGPGTPAGQLLRCYWQPLAYVGEVGVGETHTLRILGEDLVLYRSGEEEYGLVKERCSHRGASLAYGFVEDGCRIRCPYHGWTYDESGAVVQMPFEPAGSKLLSKVRHPAYPVRTLGGIVFGYLGTGEPPVLPRWDVLARRDGVRTLERRPTVNANWLQIQENSADVTHTFFLHGHMLHTRQVTHPSLDTYYRPFVRYGFRKFRWGILKSFTVQKGGDESLSEVGNPLIFPNMLRIREGLDYEAMHWRVPVDDTHTMIMYAGFKPSDDTSLHGKPARIVMKDEWQTEDGRYIMDREFYSQDKMAWETPGELFDRTSERLGASDKGIVLFRRMLAEELERVERGLDPLGVLRGPDADQMISITTVAEEDLEADEGNQGLGTVELDAWRAPEEPGLGEGVPSAALAGSGSGTHESLER